MCFNTEPPLKGISRDKGKATFTYGCGCHDATPCDSFLPAWETNWVMLNFLAPSFPCLSSVLDAEHTQKTSLGGWVVSTLALLSELKIIKKKKENQRKESTVEGLLKRTKHVTPFLPLWKLYKHHAYEI